MYMRKIMAGAMFAGGRVSSFHLTSLARHSVHRLLLRRWLEGLDSLRWLQVGFEQASQPNTDVRRAAAPTRPAALLLFQICTRNRPRHQHHQLATARSAFRALARQKSPRRHVDQPRLSRPTDI